MLLFHLRNFISVDSNKSYNIHSNFMHDVEQSIFVFISEIHMI